MVSVVPGIGAAVESATEHFDALAHAAQAVAFAVRTATAVIVNLQAAVAILLLQAQAAGAGVRVAHDVGHGFAHGKRENALLHGGKLAR